jgi:ERCC4-type nuclease
MTTEPKPIIVIDNREQLPLAFKNLSSVRGTLTTGDYSIQGLEDMFSIERKTIADLVGCCSGDNRDRIERELCRLRGMAFARLFAIGNLDDITLHRYQSRINPAAVIGTLAAFEVRYVPVVWSATP